MKTKIFIICFLFFSLLSISFASSAITIDGVFPNMHLDWDESVKCQALNQTFQGADYYCLGFGAYGEWQYNCAWHNDGPSMAWFYFPTYYNITFGYQDTGGGVYYDALCVRHSYIGNDTNPYHLFPVYVEAFDEDSGTMYSHTITIGIDNQTSSSNPGGVSSGKPILEKNFSDYVLGNDTSSVISLYQYFENADSYTIILEFISTNNMTRVLTANELVDSEQCIGDVLPTYSPFTFCLSSMSGIMELSMYNYNSYGEVIVNVIGENDFGFTYDSFLVTSYSASAPDILYPNASYDGSRIGGYFVNLFDSAFPSEDVLSTKAKFLYVFLTFGLVVFVVLLVGHKNMKASSYLIGILCVLLTFYFFSIGYIPTSVLVVFSIIGISLSYFKFRGG